ncbi:MAG: hypothetical protein ACKVY0_11385 [Prosthecobacter sp.]|uniref:hypothetical protein n=1 Tax=Prosthecobacter sp. TaxID=1965333 RepID=UPI00390128A8
MKTTLLSVIALQLGLTAAVCALEATTIETAQGKTYQKCRIMKRDPDGVSFMHSKGAAKVLFTDLTEPMRSALGYDAMKAHAYEKERADARKEAEQARRDRETKLAAAMIAAQARYAAQQPMVLMQQPYGGFTGLAPVLGLGGIGYPSSFHHYGHGARQSRGWSNTGIASIGAGTGGIYVPQSGGLVFTGFPGVQYSPTLGYTNARNNNPTASPFFGTQHSGVIPGVAIPGSASAPLHR